MHRREAGGSGANQGPGRRPPPATTGVPRRGADGRRGARSADQGLGAVHHHPRLVCHNVEGETWPPSLARQRGKAADTATPRGLCEALPLAAAVGGALGFGRGPGGPPT
jgi:hypothetical protein